MLEQLLENGESEMLACFRERFRPEDLAETLVAFANGNGGSAVIGISGRVRPKVEGVQDIQAAEEAALEAALACTPPLVLPLPQQLTSNQQTVLLIEVPPGLPNVYSLHGKYLRREGPSNAPIPPNALRQLLIERGEVGWERVRPENVAMGDLSEMKIQSYVARIGSPADGDPLGWLYRRGCLTRDNQAVYQPTNAGMLLFSITTERDYPQCELTLVRYTGNEMSDEFERVDIRTTLPDQVRRAELWLGEHMRRGSRMIGLEREDWTEYPPAAVREALVNAVAHRDYTVRGEGIRIAMFVDRLEVYSPGRLPGHVTIDNIAAERFSRNETLVQVLADLGLIERLGYGIDRMQRQMADAGLPPPEFRETAAGFLVTLRNKGMNVANTSIIDTAKWEALGLNERQIGALVFLTENRRITNRDLQDLSPDVSPETIRRDLSDLVDRGLILKIGQKRATYYILR
ncbi:ATP-binding protein [Herpetosiphon llansteffanensis]|uniref:ATP-binding protein n=1 Tax=Herpetosiphon llansteffanensis TaxID=2094568 RepID=UPI000D7BA02A|nr:ATP-binding protein [Herpetosiphon llansteffanensis]